MTGNLIPPSAEEEAREDRIQEIRDSLDADFKAGRLGIENGWLFAYNDPCPTPCCGPYGCPPSCATTPIMDLAATFRPLPRDGGFL